jgi:hypothetical protein
VSVPPRPPSPITQPASAPEFTQDPTDGARCALLHMAEMDYFSLFTYKLIFRKNHLAAGAFLGYEEGQIGSVGI